MKKRTKSTHGLRGGHKLQFKKKIFGEWSLNKGEIMRVSVENFKGRLLVHVRNWRHGANGELYPTPKGATITIDKLPRLLRALRSVRAHAREIGLLAPPSRSR
jgi:Transcriptional Coactivator p15 (PC4)